MRLCFNTIYAGTLRDSLTLWRRIVSLERAGLNAKASDRQIVEVASERRWIIVTVNGDDFIEEIKRYLSQTKKLACHDLYGLVVIPNDSQIQKHFFASLRRTTKFSGQTHQLERRMGVGLLCASHKER